MSKKRRKHPQGFTLIEMSVVVAIIGILYCTVVPLYGTTIQRTRETALKQDLFVLRKTVDDYFRDHEEWPKSLQVLVERGYLRAVPVDPMTKKTDTWVVVPSEPGENNLYDVRSGATGDSLDGIPYREF